MPEEFNLSDKIHEELVGLLELNDKDKITLYWIEVKEVKEFIKRLKETLCGDLMDDLNVDGHIIEGKINQLAGDKLK